MGWPDSGYLWRDGAKPAQEQYAAVAKAISEFEPLTMFANAGEVRSLSVDRWWKHTSRLLSCSPTRTSFAGAVALAWLMPVWWHVSCVLRPPAPCGA